MKPKYTEYRNAEGQPLNRQGKPCTPAEIYFGMCGGAKSKGKGKEVVNHNADGYYGAEGKSDGYYAADGKIKGLFGDFLQGLKDKQDAKNQSLQSQAALNASIAAQMNQPTDNGSTGRSSGGMSPMAIGGIVLGAAVLGGIAYFVLRPKKA